MFDKRVNKAQSQFTVPLMETGFDHRKKSNKIELEVIIGKVEERKWRLFKTYTQEKVVAVATGTLYERREGKNLREAIRLGEIEDSTWTPDTTWRDYSEQDVQGDERSAIVDAVREVSLDIYEDKAKIFGIDAATVFTQIMIGFIVGGDVPPPSPAPVRDPYAQVRSEMKQDFFDNTGIEPEDLSL